MNTTASQSARSARPDRRETPSLRVYHSPACIVSAELPLPLPIASLLWQVDEIPLETRIWTDGQFSQIPKARRPANAIHAPGVGWVELRIDRNAEGP